MKKIAMCLLAACLSLTLLPLQANASTNVPATTTNVPSPAAAAEAKTLELRLYEINAMDKTNLKSSEKKSIRKEVRSINHKLREIGGGVYVSAGALIVILIILIIVL